eukprot:4871852-Pyramimonas_sp.AAC.1
MGHPSGRKAEACKVSGILPLESGRVRSASTPARASCASTDSVYLHGETNPRPIRSELLPSFDSYYTVPTRKNLRRRASGQPG